MRDVAQNKNVISGVLFIVIALLFWFVARNLPMGSAARMGPGYFPVLLSCLLGLLGLALMLDGVLARRTHADDRERPSDQPPMPWRAIGMIIASTVAFGLLLHPLGFLPALGVTALLSTFASRKIQPASAVLLSVGITAFCWAVFIVGLGLPLPLVNFAFSGN